MVLRRFYKVYRLLGDLAKAFYIRVCLVVLFRDQAFASLLLFRMLFLTLSPKA